MSFLLTALTTDRELVRQAAAAGVDRIGIDIEIHGKLARQGHILGARVSSHSMEDLGPVATSAAPANSFIRLNPLHPGTREEVEQAISLGAKVLMLPYYTTPAEVETFVRLVDQRANPIILLENTEAIACLPDTLLVGGLSELMVGLNDLSLSLRLRSPFEAVAAPLMQRIAGSVLAAGWRFGFGGLARMDGTLQPSLRGYWRRFRPPFPAPFPPGIEAPVDLRHIQRGVHFLESR